MTPITIWTRKNDKGVFEHNHIEDGHVEFGPKILHPNQAKAWPRATWKYEHAFLSNEQPPRVLTKVTVEDLDRLCQLARIVKNRFGVLSSTSNIAVGYADYADEYFKAEHEFEVAFADIRERMEAHK
jgi:hypothetical protein